MLLRRKKRVHCKSAHALRKLVLCKNAYAPRKGQYNCKLMISEKAKLPMRREVKEIRTNTYKARKAVNSTNAHAPRKGVNCESAYTPRKGVNSESACAPHSGVNS